MNKVHLDVNLLGNLMRNLENGKKSADFMRRFILENNNNNNNDNDYKSLLLDHHCMVALDTFDICLSQLKIFQFDLMIPKLEDPYFESRKCYKRRKIEDSREEEVEHVIDDGYVWRKYGQKLIMNSPHPRHYYRCTNKHDQKCQATKQVQQISNYPTKYKINYKGNHSCNNSSPFLIDSPDEHSSGIVLSFDNSYQVDPLMFPPSAFPGFVSSSPSSENVSSSNPVYKQSEEISFENNSLSATSYNFEQGFSTITPDFTDLLPYF